MTFNGFPEETVQFLQDLRANNSKAWFETHRNEYEQFFKAPAMDFVSVMGEKLRTVAPKLNAIPAIDKSIFRIHRDIRFSKDKTPFKTNMALWFWEGTGNRTSCSGFYLDINPEEYMVGIGIYIFPPELLEQYRKHVSIESNAVQLQQAINTLTKKGYEVGGKNYKKTPVGYDKNYKYADFLLYDGVYAGLGGTHPPELFTKDCIEFCFQHFKNMLPLHHWLLEFIRK